MHPEHYKTQRELLGISIAEVAEHFQINRKTAFDWEKAARKTDIPQHAEEYINLKWGEALAYVARIVGDAREKTMRDGKSPETIYLPAFTTIQDVQKSGLFPLGTTVGEATALVGLAEFTLNLAGFATVIKKEKEMKRLDAVTEFATVFGVSTNREDHEANVKLFLENPAEYIIARDRIHELNRATVTRLTTKVAGVLSVADLAAQITVEKSDNGKATVAIGEEYLAFEVDTTGNKDWRQIVSVAISIYINDILVSLSYLDFTPEEFKEHWEGNELKDWAKKLANTPDLQDAKAVRDYARAWANGEFSN